MEPGSGGVPGQRRRLVVGVSALVLTLVLLVSTILEPVWFGWLAVLAGLCTSAACLIDYRKNRTR
ncbi:hypothetical protein OHA70_01500 [Kribbella sp. NBC_00382]|uniref:hypothetical protein n=1 Tax=Kribbella sp. NBC_00382 TaxID=2975967 RepID=UPI002E1FD169